ncbi:MAG: nuclear transport factor 2 family protein [Ilumatobacteraceae bacterium]
MNEIDVLLIERDCERVVVASATCNDQRQFAALADLYTVDGVVVRPNGQRLEGRAAIEGAYAAGPPDRVTRHLCANVRVDVDGPDAARATTVVLILSGVRSDDPDVTFGVVPSERHLVGEFADRLVRTDAGWRIAERRATLTMNT